MVHQTRLMLSPIGASVVHRATPGAGACATGADTARALGIDPDADRAHDDLARMPGARDIALGPGGCVPPSAARRRFAARPAEVDVASAAPAALGPGQRELRR